MLGLLAMDTSSLRATRRQVGSKLSENRKGRQSYLNRRSRVVEAEQVPETETEPSVLVAALFFVYRRRRGRHRSRRAETGDTERSMRAGSWSTVHAGARGKCGRCTGAEVEVVVGACLSRVAACVNICFRAVGWIPPPLQPHSDQCWRCRPGMEEGAARPILLLAGVSAWFATLVTLRLLWPRLDSDLTCLCFSLGRV